MREFLAKLEGSEEKPSAVLAKMAEAFRVQEEASQLTPLYIPPRPSTLQETTTAQVLTSLRDEPQQATDFPPQATEPLSAATHEENAPSTSIPVPNQSHAEITEYTVEEVLAEAEKAGKGGEVVGKVQEDVVGKKEERVYHHPVSKCVSSEDRVQIGREECGRGTGIIGSEEGES